MKFSHILGLSLALGSMLSAQGGLKPQGKIVATTLSHIRSHPDAYKNVRVSFSAQFTSVGKISNPFFTQFVPSRYANLYAWANEQPIWKRDQYSDTFGYLFLSKKSHQLDEIYQLRLYERIRVTGVVQNIFQGSPWIEINSFDRLDKKVNSATLAHLYRGEMFMQKRQWTKAISELSLAPAADVPNHVLVVVHKNLAVCYLRLGESGTAVNHLESAISMMDEVDDETRRLAIVAQTAPSQELDRAIAFQKVAEHERPMWEAFRGTLARPARPAHPPAPDKSR